MKYSTVYNFLVFDLIKDGVTVYALDREARVCCDVNDLPVGQAMAMVKGADVNPGRYEFWYEEAEEATKETEEEENE